MDSAERVLRRIEAEPQKYPIIIGRERGRVLDEVVTKYHPKRVLEVGTFVGYSAIRIGRLLPEGGRMTCLDKDAEVLKLARKHIEDAGLSDRIELKAGDAKLTIQSVGGPLDMVFLDADKTEYLRYLKLLEGKLRKGSVVAADNVKTHAGELVEYLDYVRNSGRYSSSYHEVGADAVEVSVKL